MLAEILYVCKKTGRRLLQQSNAYLDQSRHWSALAQRATQQAIFDNQRQPVHGSEQSSKFVSENSEQVRSNLFYCPQTRTSSKILALECYTVNSRVNKVYWLIDWLATEAVSKLYEAGELVDERCHDPQKLQQTAWFFITLYFGRRGRENQRQLTKSSLKLSKTPNSGLEYFELNRETPGGVFSTKNHQVGLDGTDDPSDGKMFEGKGLANCPVAVVKAYLSHLNPKCEALFQKPLTGAKFKPSSDVIWYSTLPLGHNTIDSMMKNMCLRAGIDPPFTNHCVRSTTVNILSSKDMKNRHIRAVTGHKSDASLESYNDRPTFEQFKNMSSAITDFINFCRPDHQVAINPLAELNCSPLETVSKAIHSSTSTNVQENIFVQENMSTNVAHGIISGGSFSNYSFNFHFK